MIKKKESRFSSIDWFDAMLKTFLVSGLMVAVYFGSYSIFNICKINSKFKERKINTELEYSAKKNPYLKGLMPKKEHIENPLNYYFTQNRIVKLGETIITKTPFIGLPDRNDLEVIIEVAGELNFPSVYDSDNLLLTNEFLTRKDGKYIFKISSTDRRININNYLSGLLDTDLEKHVKSTECLCDIISNDEDSPKKRLKNIYSYVRARSIYELRDEEKSISTIFNEISKNGFFVGDCAEIGKLFGFLCLSEGLPVKNKYQVVLGEGIGHRSNYILIMNKQGELFYQGIDATNDNFLYSSKSNAFFNIENIPTSQITYTTPEIRITVRSNGDNINEFLYTKLSRL